MYLKDSYFEHYDHFEIEPAAITLRTLDKRNINLPYTGPLPVEFDGAENPRISMFVRPGDVRVVLFANRDGKRISASVEATDKEIDDLLFRFFYKEGKDSQTFPTRPDSGLNPYWMGCYQAEYMMWRQITLEGYIASVASQLPDDKRAGLLRFLQRMESATA